MYMLYRYLFLPKHCSESKWERLCLYGTKNYKEMSTEKRRRLHGMLQEGWEGLKIKHRHLSIVLKQATHWLCLMLLLLVSYQFDHKVFFGCLLSSYMVMPILHTLRSVWISKDSFLYFLFNYFVFLAIQSKPCTQKQWHARAMSQRHSKTFAKPPIRNFLEVF